MRITRERRTILLAVLASLLLHFAVAISLASFGDKLQKPIPEEEKPPELTMVDVPATPPPAVPKNAPFIDTPDKRASKEEPKEKTFESNANSIAASQQPAAGSAPIPTQDGKELPGIDFDTERHTLAMQGAQPLPTPQATIPPAKPSPRPTATPATPRPTAEPSVTPEPEQLAMLRSTPPPAMTAPQESEPSAPPDMPTPEPSLRPTPSPPTPASAYRREQVPTRMTGNFSNRGVASVNAIGTPLGRYAKTLQDAVGSRWYMYLERQRDLVSIGTVHLRFFVDRSGRVKNLKVISNTSNESFAGVCLQSVQEVKLPPIPEDVADALPPEGLDEELTFNIY